MPFESLFELVREALFPQLNRLHAFARSVYARLCQMFIVDIESRLPFYVRFYIYALHGLFVEILFTAVWQVAVTGNRKLHGLTSLWAALIYGTSILAGEQLYVRLQKRMNIFLRGFVYLLWAYFWEFSWGLLLRQFDACPWHYEFRGHIMGLITLEYAPAWYVAGLLSETVLLRNTRRLCFSEKATKKS